MQVHFMLQQRLLLRLVALTLSLVLSSHSFASAYSCLNSSTSDFGSAINATVSVTESPFRTPSGPQSLVSGSNSWQWTLATESFYAGEKNVSISQNLWLDTQPLADLYSADFGYLGCGIVIHGLKTSVQQKAVVDRASGTCNSVLSYDCGVELFDAPIDYARNLSGFEFMNITDICRGFTLLGGRWKALGVTEKCMDDLTKDAWIETFPYASPQLEFGPACQPLDEPPNHYQSADDSQFAIPFTWGVSSYTSSDYKGYDNLTQSITPFMAVLFSNHTTDYNNSQGYSQGNLWCLQPQVVSGSRVPPKPIGSGAGRVEMLKMATLLVVLVILVNGTGLFS